MLTSSCPHICTSTLFMLWDSKINSKRLYITSMCNPSKEKCFLALKVDAGSAFFQWVEPRAGSSGFGLSPGLLMGTDKILRSQSYRADSMHRPEPWPCTHISLHSSCNDGTREELGLNQLQSADLEHACYRQITAAKRWLWFILIFFLPGYFNSDIRQEGFVWVVALQEKAVI